MCLQHSLGFEMAQLSHHHVLLEFSGSEMRVFPDSGIALATWGQFTADSEGFPIGSSEDMVFAEKLDQFYMQSDLQFCL